MRELTIGKNDAGQRLDRFVAKSLPLLPPTLLQKYIRLKRIKVNGRGAKRDTRLESGDILQLYATEVHVRIASPAIKFPCFYGVDTSTFKTKLWAMLRKFFPRSSPK